MIIAWRIKMNKHTIPIALAMALATTMALAMGTSIAFAAPTVTLNQPASNSYNSSAEPIVFTFTPVIPSTDAAVLTNCSLWLNISGTFTRNKGNVSALTNNTVANTNLSGLVESSASYIWNINCTTNESGLLSGVASTNRTTMFDRGKPNITVLRPSDGETFANNPGYFSVTTNESTNISVEGFNSVNTIENISIANRSTSGTYNYVFYTSDRMYWARFNAKDQAGNEIVFANYTFWHNFTSSSGGGGGPKGGRTDIKVLPPVTPAEVPVGPAIAPPRAVTATERIAAVFGDIANAIASVPSRIADFFRSLFGL